MGNHLNNPQKSFFGNFYQQAIENAMEPWASQLGSGWLSGARGAEGLVLGWVLP